MGRLETILQKTVTKCKVQVKQKKSNKIQKFV